MRKAALFFVFPLLAAADPAAPQAPKPAPPEERPAAPAPQLNLRLDEPGRFARETPREDSGSARALPSLGDNARPLPARSIPTTTQPFPKDAERSER